MTDSITLRDAADRKLGKSIAEILVLQLGDEYELRTPKTRTDQLVIVKISRTQGGDTTSERL
ncbi:MAG: hypothetical protein ABSC50_14260 [Candidatus Bathyarchaeia archaeon]